MLMYVSNITQSLSFSPHPAAHEDTSNKHNNVIMHIYNASQKNVAAVCQFQAKAMRASGHSRNISISQTWLNVHISSFMTTTFRAGKMYQNNKIVRTITKQE